MPIDYKSAGVDREAGYEEVKKIKEIVKKTPQENVLSSIGGFSGLYRLPIEDYEEPVLVSGTDGVGTKLKIAFMMGKHDTIGQDCVAMCVNDILCQGARPLFFLDYIGTGVLEPDKMADVVRGIADGCHQAECSLIGGETAEMPGFYDDGEYDLAGFAVGVVEKSKIIDGSKIQEGDSILALGSSGVHSNGFSLIRAIIFDKMNLSLDEKYGDLDVSLGEELIKPTKIYHQALKSIEDIYEPHGYVHVTGGGLYENIPRIMPEGLRAKIDLSDYQEPEIFKLIGEWGGISRKEMFSTFNMGFGLLIILNEKDEGKVMETLKNHGHEVMKLGHVEKGEGGLDLCL